jgi:hypothetical protein
LKNFWDEERKFVDANYTNVPFPFPEVATPLFAIEYYWTMEQLEGYLNTWSALRKFQVANKHNPVPV